MKVLVTGGAGFIGSHTVLALRDADYQPVVLDNLSNGHRDAVPADVPFYQRDITETDAVESILQIEQVTAVIHFAAFIEAGVSVREPLSFYHNNVYGSACLLEAMRRAAVQQIVFSSTAAIFGNPETVPIPETAAKRPTNPYGETKWAVETMLRSCDAAYGMRSVALRYFNAAGADPQGRSRERHTPETHLIPLALAAARGERPALTIFGTDYPTEDGTCIRDYIHVSDLADAHVKALAYLEAGHPSDVFNLGTGSGYSVRQVIETVHHVTGLAVPVQAGARREGDPVALVADSQKAQQILGWSPRYPHLADMVRDAWG